MDAAPARARRWQRLRALGWRDRLLVAEAVVELPLAALVLRRVRLGTLLALLERVPPRGVGAGRVGARRRRGRGGDAQLARDVATAVAIAGSRGFWTPNCLQRSVVLWWFLRRRGIESDLRIGVRRGPDAAAMEFHAWVEHEGAVLNDAADIREQFATFDRPFVPPRAVFR